MMEQYPDHTDLLKLIQSKIAWIQTFLRDMGEAVIAHPPLWSLDQARPLLLPGTLLASAREPVLPVC
jgi:hypothetical protein